MIAHFHILSPKQAHSLQALSPFLPPPKLILSLPSTFALLPWATTHPMQKRPDGQFTKFKQHKQYPSLLPTNRPSLHSPSIAAEKGRGKFFSPLDERMVVITFIQKMGRKRIKGTKYNRVTKQQKYVFLKLCITEKQSIHEAAFNAGIHYSTAKTILFFHKKQYKNYSTYIVDDPQARPLPTNALMAAWREIPIDVDQEQSEPCRIELVVNSKKRMLEERLKAKEKSESTSQGRESEGMPVKMEDADLLFFLRHQKTNNGAEKRLQTHPPQGEDLPPLPKAECPLNFFY